MAGDGLLQNTLTRIRYSIMSLLKALSLYQKKKRVPMVFSNSE